MRVIYIDKKEYFYICTP